MAEFINTKKEIAWGNWYFCEHVMPAEFNHRARKKELSPYYAKYGFQVSMMYDDFYSHFSGIHSDRYASMDLVYQYMFPALCRVDFMNAYTDKNFFSYIYPDVTQPQTVVKRRNGIFFNAKDRQISYDEAKQIALNVDGSCIIKPTVETANGNGVSAFDNAEMRLVDDQFVRYGYNFIIQRKLVQHPAMAKFNPDSFNTIRILTYRDVNHELHWMKEITHLRIGGKGSVRDNLSSGGVACHVMPNGKLVDACTWYKKMKIGSMREEYGISDYIIPNFDKMVNFALSLHERLPFFDFIGWDIGLLENGEPVFIEYNLIPGVEGPQMIAGPLFGDYLDEVMERVKRVKKTERKFAINTFDRPGFNYYYPLS